MICSCCRKEYTQKDIPEDMQEILKHRQGPQTRCPECFYKPKEEVARIKSRFLRQYCSTCKKIKQRKDFGHFNKKRCKECVRLNLKRCNECDTVLDANEFYRGSAICKTCKIRKQVKAQQKKMQDPAYRKKRRYQQRMYYAKNVIGYRPRTGKGQGVRMEKMVQYQHDKYRRIAAMVNPDMKPWDVFDLPCTSIDRLIASKDPSRNAM